MSQPVLPIRVLLYAQYRKMAGMTERVLLVPGPANVRDVLRQIAQEVPSLRDVVAEAMAPDGAESQPVFVIGQRMVTLDTPVNTGDELKLLPPISGGREM